MDISAIIAKNLSAWMDANPSMDTLQKVEAKSGAGFGTIRRARKGEGNITVEKLQMIAAAFGRTAADLLLLDEPVKSITENPERLLPSANVAQTSFAAESRREYVVSWPFPHVSQDAYQALPDDGKVWVQGRLDAAIEQARQQFGTAAEKRSA